MSLIGVSLRSVTADQMGNRLGDVTQRLERRQSAADSVVKVGKDESHYVYKYTGFHGRQKSQAGV